mmetsp:Transcript_18944/g.44096  ORF Transcript_18944/g.44096 Transcript_18944/m.44096 type:complete len:302 (+) Transcript_18944:138-1043(+)
MPPHSLFASLPQSSSLLSFSVSSVCRFFSFLASAKSSAAAAFAFAASTSLSSAFNFATSSSPPLPLVADSSLSASDPLLDGFSSARVLPFLCAFFAFLMSFSTALSCAEISLVSEVVRSNSSLALASRRASFSSSSFSLAAMTTGSRSQGSFLASSSLRRCSSSLRFFSLASSSAFLASRFFSSASRPRFRSSSAAMSLSSFARFASSAASFVASIFAAQRSWAVWAAAPSNHTETALSHSFLAALFTSFVTSLISSSDKPHFLPRERISVVRSSEAYCGCQACAHSTFAGCSASTLPGRQ